MAALRSDGVRPPGVAGGRSRGAAVCRMWMVKRTLVVAVTAAATTIAGAALGAPGALAANPVGCGDVISTDVTLVADLVCSGAGLRIGSGGVTVDLAGHSIVGDGTGIGVRFTGDSDTEPPGGVTIRNGAVRNFQQAVLLAGVDDVTLAGLSLIPAATAADPVAVFLDVVHGVTVEGGTLRGPIRSSSTTALRLSRATVVGAGLQLGRNTRDTVIERSLLVDAPVGFVEATRATINTNVLVRSPVSVLNTWYVTVSRNQFLGAGMRLRADAAGTEIVGNLFARAPVGVETQDVLAYDVIAPVRISGNQFVDDGAAGVLIDAALFVPAQVYTIENNVFVRNGFRSAGRTDLHGAAVNDGLHIALPGAVPVTVSGNQTWHNADYGIEAQPGTITDGGGNRSTADPHGCLGVDCTR